MVEQLKHTSIPYQKDGADVVGVGAYRLLATFTGPASEYDEKLPDDIRSKMQRALDDFPELVGKTVTVGRLNPDEDAAGRAMFFNLLVLYPVDSVTSWTTVYHELGHLAIHVRNQRDEDVPITSEEFCSIFSVARMPTALRCTRCGRGQSGASAPREEWPEICQRALAYREENHDYIKQCREWLGVDDDE